jgi:signal transduction histidine kinase
VWTGGGLVYGTVHPIEPVPAPGGRYLEVSVGGLVYVLCVWVGAYIGLRRDHVRSLQERVETAEREQASRAAQARANERARIAREMHDVLAHRMSLVAMHAGALAYRTDLPPEKVAETAAVVQAGAHAALQDLRDVLGVLRSADGAHAGAADGGDHPRPERPQPTLADLDELVAEARAGGGEVRVERRADGLGELPEAVSRNAYRIVQEALTNARKHAPWAPVTVGVAGAPGEGLALTVRNPLRTVGPAPQEAPPSSGLGLVGLTERAELSGGRLAYGAQGGQFVVSAWLPWAP